MSIVSVVKSDYTDIYPNLERAIALAGSLSVASNDSVVIKINMCGARTPETGAITHPELLGALLGYLRNNYENLDISVVESDATTELADLFIKWLGYLPVLEKWNARWVNLSQEKMTAKRIKGRYLKEVPVAKLFDGAYFITLPKLKTNLLTGITCCLKNQFGCLPMVEKSIYHLHIDDVIADVNLAFHPDFCIADGIISMGGELGPGTSVPIPLKAIVCGNDAVAVDTYCARIVGFTPWLIGHIRKAARSNVGSMEYTLVGDEIPGVDFEISKMKIWLLKLGSFLQRHAQKRARVAWRKSK